MELFNQLDLLKGILFFYFKAVVFEWLYRREVVSEVFVHVLEIECFGMSLLAHFLDFGHFLD